MNGNQVQTFAYDWLDRLTSASTNAAGTGQYSDTYAYDATGNIVNNDGSAYAYSATQPHAVTAAFGNTYSYDANGNQTGRTIGGVAYTFTFDYENRLTDVKQGTTTVATFLYDAEGNRVKGAVNGTTTAYVAGIYEYQAGAVTSYYEGGAFRRSGYVSGNGVFYLLRDHLGSSSVLVEQDGTLAKREYYYPYGGNRGTAFSTLTTKRFTGQYHEQDLPGGEGLSYYNARWYDAQLRRFVSADTVVPDPGDPQALNRLAYVRNNPLRFVDPTGHAYDDGYGILWRFTSQGELRPINLYAPGAGHSDRDLTYFIATQARSMLENGDINNIRIANRLPSLLTKAYAYLTFKSLVGDGKPWDFKDRMKKELGNSFRLCSRYECNWYEYSVIGNILYGYIGKYAAFTGFEIRAGAGYAEATDPENKDNYNTPLGYLPKDRIRIGFDAPEDYRAVGMGMEMYRRYGTNVTVRDFQAFLVDYGDTLAAGQPINTSVDIGHRFPYDPGTFTNPGGGK